MIELTDDDVMIDIETLGVSPGCAILSIGACSVLNPTKTFYVVCSDPLECGLFASSATLRWWLMQSEEARGAIACGAEPTRTALTQFKQWLQASFAAPRVWSYGAAFDLPIIQAAGRALCGWEEAPWHYRKAMCLRTLFELFDRPTAAPSPHSEHNALADAQYQALLLRIVAGLDLS